jgi:hypothetical protein
MSFNLTWPKVAALASVQAAAQTAIGVLTAGGSTWAHTGYVSGISALVAFLGLVVAYKLPDGPAQAVSAPAPLNATAPAPAVVVADADEAKKPSP